MTTRYIATLTMCIAIAVLSVPRTEMSTLLNTGNELDIAIVGRGNICLIDNKTAAMNYTRSGDLSIDVNGQLVVNIDGAQWVIDPPVQIPNDWERIAILPDGRVQTLQAGSWNETGQLQLVVFTPTTVFDDPLAANPRSDDTGPPLHTFPGQGAGFIQQGWLEQRSSYLNQLAVRILIGILVAGVLWRFASFRSNNQDKSSLPQSLKSG